MHTAHCPTERSYGACGALSASGDECDLYVSGKPHGGLMHSGLRDGNRIWWSKATGRVVNFDIEAPGHPGSSARAASRLIQSGTPESARNE